LVIKKQLLLGTLIFLISTVVFSQKSCYNVDFETGAFDGWEGGTGLWDKVDVDFGVLPGRQTIVTGKGMDANTCDAVPIVAPGGMFSARLGNQQDDRQVDRLSYTLNVEESNTLFIYKYAVVLQDPGHAPNEQPYFKVSVFDENRKLIDPDCGQYNVSASSNLPGFKTCGINSVVFKNWTTVGLNLSDYIGKRVTVEFETGDCRKGDHFGYAYVEAYCSSIKINSTYCAAVNKTILTAPIGFSYLWDTGETTITIDIDNPVNGQKHSCVLTSATGCKVEISTVLTLKEPIVNFEAIGTCENAETLFLNTSSNTDNFTNSFQWDFGDGTTSDLENPRHKFSSNQEYNVRFSISSRLGCGGEITKKIKISPKQEPRLSDGFICLDSSGKVFQPCTLSSGLPSGGFTYSWYLDGKLLPQATGNTYVTSQIGKYSVLAVDNSTGCLGKSFATVVINQVPNDVVIKQFDAFTDSSFLDVEVVGGTGPFQYQLDNSTFQDSNVFRDLPYGDHQITVKDNSNCTSIKKPVSIIGYPKFFTPNNDGYNDFWNIPNNNYIVDAQITIFDRYGKLIKQLMQNDVGWDGRLNGVLMPATDYWFTLNYIEIGLNGESKPKLFKSHFSLKR
jgi:gliding motility-associated-like protein